MRASIACNLSCSISSSSSSSPSEGNGNDARLSFVVDCGGLLRGVGEGEVRSSMRWYFFLPLGELNNASRGDLGGHRGASVVGGCRLGDSLRVTMADSCQKPGGDGRFMTNATANSSQKSVEAWS